MTTQQREAVRAMFQKLASVREWGRCERCGATGRRVWSVCMVCRKAEDT